MVPFTLLPVSFMTCTLFYPTYKRGFLIVNIPSGTTLTLPMTRAQDFALTQIKLNNVVVTSRCSILFTELGLQLKRSDIVHRHAIHHHCEGSGPIPTQPQTMTAPQGTTTWNLTRFLILSSVETRQGLKENYSLSLMPLWRWDKVKNSQKTGFEVIQDSLCLKNICRITVGATYAYNRDWQHAGFVVLVLSRDHYPCKYWLRRITFMLAIPVCLFH